MAVIYATLVVNTKVLSENPSKNITEACLLYDSNLNPTGSESFAINATKGDKIIFNIVSKNNKTPICFFEFGQESKEQVFPSSPSYPNWKGTVDQSGDYFIKFEVPSIQDLAFILDLQISINT